MKRTVALAALVALFVCGFAIYTSKPTEGSPASYQASSIRPNDEIIAVAQSYLGMPYGYGPGQLSCSEFTRAVYGQATGVWMGTSPDEQAYSGWTPLKTKRGDLLLYDEVGYGNITHVGIYEGDGMLIHSSSYFGAVVESEAKYLAYAYVGTRRIR
jgi:cell wall-associated NlpC family hydrolase